MGLFDDLFGNDKKKSQQACGLFSFMNEQQDENDNEYIYYYLYYLYITNYYDSIVSTGIQPNLNAEQLKNLLLYIPTYEEQSIISKRFISLDKRINLETEKINKLSELKKGLMQSMFV